MDTALEADDSVCDAAKTALMCMVSAVVVAAILVWQAINYVIPAIIGEDKRVVCIIPRKKREQVGIDAGTQTNISTRTESDWRTFIRKNKFLSRLAKNMQNGETEVSINGKNGSQLEKNKVNNSPQKEMKNTDLQYILLESKQALKEKIASLEQCLYETLSRNDGLKESLMRIERKRSASSKDVEAYWRHWQCTQSLLIDANDDLSAATVRMQMNRPTAAAMTPDGSGEAVRFTISASDSKCPSMPL